MDYNLENFNIITRDTKTENDYLIKAIQLIKKAKKELQLSDTTDIDFRQLAIWLCEHKKNIKSSTWRYYKSSILYFLESYDSLEAIEAINYLKDIKSEGSLKHSTKTSSLKLKKICHEDWNKLYNYLISKNNKWNKELIEWLKSSLITGLRPIEWKNAKLETLDDKPVLLIKNAKFTNNRSHGEFRTLLLENLTHENLQIIKNHLNTTKTFVGMDEYEYFYRGCSVALNKACRSCWPRRKQHITLYSARHQFSSNAKLSGFTKAEIAAMMGHAVDITATIHYGRKQSGNEQLSITPLQEDVEKVREIKVSDFKTFIDTKQDNLL